MKRRDIFKLLGSAALVPAAAKAIEPPAPRSGLRQTDLSRARVVVDEVWQWDGSLIEVPIRDHPCIRSIRNKRHRNRTLKKYEKQGVRTYLAPRAT